MSSLARPIFTASCGEVAGGVVLGSSGGSKLLSLGLADAADAAGAGADAAGAAEVGACVGAAASGAPLVGGSGGFGSLCADAGRALSGMSTALSDAAVLSGVVVVLLMSSCSSVL